MEDLDRAQVQRLVGTEDAQLVEVVPTSDYEDEHLPGAVNIPLRQLVPEAHRRLNPARPVIVYSFDSL